MKWHEYPTLLKSAAISRGIANWTPRQIFSELRNVFTGSESAANTIAQIYSEMKWIESDRPYYELWPSVGEAFMSVDLERLKCDDIHLPLPQLLVRMPVGKELQISQKMKMRSLLAMEMPSDGLNPRGLIVCINDGSTLEINGHDVAIHTLNCVKMVSGTNIYEHILAGRAKPYSQDVIDYEAVDNATRLVCTLCLLKDNPDLIEPLPLEKDLKKWEETHDPNLILKAEKRGKRGWAIGKRIETAPGFRRPHFAIRWCGKGRTDPRVRPIKGCLVNRRKVEEVPTDWLGSEEL